MDIDLELAEEDISELLNTAGVSEVKVEAKKRLSEAIRNMVAKKQKV